MPSVDYIFVKAHGEMSIVSPNALKLNSDHEQETRLSDRLHEKGVDVPFWLASKGADKGVLIRGTMDDARSVSRILDGSNDIVAAHRMTGGEMMRLFANAANSNAASIARRPSIKGGYSYAFAA